MRRVSTTGAVPLDATTIDDETTQQPSDKKKRLFQRGELLDDVYEVGEILGTGGMGQVFEAVDRRLDREVAVKALWPEFDGSYIRDEGRALAALRHPGVVAVHAMGHHGGVEYLIMERLRGLSLRDHISHRGKESPFPVDETLDILIDIADALTILHRAGFVHRDLKPDNVMLAPGNRTVLLDLGISLRQDRTQPRRRIAGSPHYMAPESISGGDIGPAADVYALGVIAFEMLTGRVPFDHRDKLKILSMHLECAPPRATDLAPNVPPHLDRLIHEMMRKDPRERPHSMDVVGAWLRGIRRGQRTLEREAPPMVLIADDDEDMRALLASFVEQAVPEARVRICADGHEALRGFRECAPDLALLDLDMPRMTGIELCMYLRGTAQAARTSIVAISGAASEADRQLLRQLGVRRFVDKLDSANELFDSIVAELRGIVRTRSRLLG